MERIDPKLLINYEFPIGKHWMPPVNGAFLDGPMQMGKVFVYPEVLVPSTADDTGMNLTALANTIYVAAREHNMSLSAYGHLDPVKFVIAATYAALMLEEIRRDLSVIGKYQFGNRTTGDMLSIALTGQDVGSNVALLPQFILRFNFLINRLNALYIPAINLLGDWLPHRVQIYRDDNGERFQYYAYVMANYYKLDVDATSATVGQLLFQAFNRSTININNRLSTLENLLSSYESDDDFVNFAVEATKAGLPKIQLKPIDSTGDSVKLPSLIEKFDIDDLLSLENAYYIAPVWQNGSVTFGQQNFSWDIKENTTTGKFEVGVWSSYSGNTYTRIVDRLPVLHPGYLSSNTNQDYTGYGDPVVNRPLFTHARISSEYGLKTFSRYIAAVANSASPYVVSGLVGSSLNQIAGTVSTQGGVGDKVVTYLATHSSTILETPYAFYRLRPTTAIQRSIAPIHGMYVDESYVLSATNFWSGFKGITYFYGVDWTGPGSTRVFHDYDYVVSLNDVNINMFNAACLWNSFTLISGGSSSRSAGHSRNKRNRGQAKENSKLDAISANDSGSKDVSKS